MTDDKVSIDIHVGGDNADEVVEELIDLLNGPDFPDVDEAHVAEPAPVEAAPVAEPAPAVETPVEESPVESAPVDEAPAPVEDAPVEATDEPADDTHLTDAEVPAVVPAEVPEEVKVDEPIVEDAPSNNADPAIETARPEEEAAVPTSADDSEVVETAPADTAVAADDESPESAQQINENIPVANP